MRFLRRNWLMPLLAVLSFLAQGEVSLRGEAMLQYFNTSWNEITAKMPELAEAGYDSIWIPPPTKAGGGLSVGYDLFDPFDLGSKDQRGSVSTFYGTEADLLRLVETAHRFGIRVYLESQQLKLTRGFSDTNYRDTISDTELPRDDAMYFGEHLGGTPPQQLYIDAGMRLLDNTLTSTLNGDFSYGPLTGLDQPGGGGISGGPGVEVGYAQSADNSYAEKRQLQYAFLLTRAGLLSIYKDGNHQAGTLGQIEKPFPANAFSNFLGQYNDGRLPNLLYIHNQFSRGIQILKWSDTNVVAYERQDKRENTSMSDADGTAMLFMMNGDSSNGQSRAITTTFPAGSYLWQYATGTADNGDSRSGFYYTVPSNQRVGDLVIPRGGYFALSWRSPEQPTVGGSTPAITILQNGGQPTSTLTYDRVDGPDGDPAFNPYGLPDTVKTDYKYSYTVPRVTSGTNLSFLARADGSAENILMELDGGVDINSQMSLGPQSGDLRDHPPGLSTDAFLGYEQMQFVQRILEKFAARDVSRDIIGSIGAETYQATIGAAGFTINNGAGTNSNTNTASYAYHDPSVVALDGQSGATAQFYPAPETAAGAPVNIYLKTAYQGQVNLAFLYYTIDGATYPEGAGAIPPTQRPR